jgi:hypothetical protein
MTQNAEVLGSTGNSWEHDIRALEEQARIAFLEADADFLNRIWVDDYTVNSPLDRLHSKAQVLDLLRAGRIRHSEYECEIEHIGRNRDIAIVMGNDRVNGPPEGTIVRRRYTNIWRFENGEWRAIARHAHVVSRESVG